MFKPDQSIVFALHKCVIEDIIFKIMSRYIQIKIIIILLIIFTCGTCNAQPKVSKGTIPTNIPFEVKSRIEKLYSISPSERSKAAFELGEMGKKADAAAPYLESMIDDAEPLEWGIRFGYDDMADSPGEEAERALVKIGKKSVARFVEKLNDRSLSFSERKEAIDHMVVIKGDNAIKALTAIIKRDEDEADLLEACAEALGRIGDPRAVDTLIGALKKRSFSRDVIVESLTRIGKPAVRALLEAIRSRNEYVRIGAAEALGKIRDRRAVKPLLKALKDTNLYVRWNAISALGNIGDRRAVSALLPFISDRDMNTRWKAAEALGGIGDKSSVGPLSNVLSADHDPYVREKAAWALGEINDRSAGQALCSALKDDEMPVREAAAEALGKIKDPIYFNRLIEALNYEDLGFRRAVIVALGRMHNPLAIDPLIQELKKEAEVSEQVGWALAAIGESSIEPLVALLNDKAPYIRQTAIVALGRIRDKKTVVYIINMLDDNDMFVRWAAVGALRDITGMRYADNAAAWRLWWNENKKTFQLQKKKTDKSAPVA